MHQSYMRPIIKALFRMGSTHKCWSPHELHLANGCHLSLQPGSLAESLAAHALCTYCVISMHMTLCKVN